MGSDSDQVILATGGYDHSIRLWQAHSGLCQRTLQHADSQVNCLDITPDRQHLAAGGYQHIRTYDINSSNTNPIVNYEGVAKNVTALGFHEQGLWMYTGGEDFSARIWDTRTRTATCQRMFETNAPVNCACLHPNQCELFIGDQSGVVYVWDLRSNHSEQLVLESDVSVQHLDVDAMGQYLVAIDNKGYCYIYTLATANNQMASPQKKIKFLAHKRYGLKCRLSPDAGLLVTSSADMTACVWRMADLSGAGTGEDVTPTVRLGDPNQRWVWDLAFSYDAHFLITASSDSVARLWSVSSGEVKREFSGHQKALTALAFRDGA
ncbi:target of rapamycin complex subunit lst8-like [Ornithodoros turicata]|uniref:target of rapamycin complex subunit lst8-like n=1 Tax=Ornithodoros turicata TaxID=34597 RepID=UPI0031393CAF